MSNCGYYRIHKGKVNCLHPTYGSDYEKWSKNLNDRCKICRRECGGIYPSQVPKADQTGWIYDVLGKVDVSKFGLGLKESGFVEILKTWKEGDDVLYEKRR